MTAKKFVGAAFICGGGILIGIGLTADAQLPLFWWLAALVCICFGLIGIWDNKAKYND
jgi:hypothetical protein